MQKTYLCLLSATLLTISIAGFGQEKPVPLGKSADLLQNFRQQINSTQQQQGISRLQLKTSDNVVLRSRVNHRQTSGKGNELLVGEIEQLPGSSFFIQAEGSQLKGNIVLRGSKKAYVYYSDGKGNAYLREEDIHKVICVDYLKAPEAASAVSSIAAAAAITDLQSYPSGVGCVLLDFDGQYVSGTLWNGGNPINAAPATLNDTEKEQVWELISEDYRPFRLNVTTSEAVYNTYPANRRMRCIFTPTNTAAPGAGGVAYLNSFTWGNETPCWVFNGGVKGAGDAGAHEVGHTFGLGHDGRTSPVEDYYLGQGDWAPIMGAGYYEPIVQWSKGEYANPSNTQDDLAIIANSTNGVGYRADDFGGTLATAAALSISSSGSVSNAGVIERTADVDMFAFTTTGGAVSLNINPAALHPDLDILATLYNSSGGVVSSSNLSGLNATISGSLAAGKYYLAVTGTGAGNVLTTGYTNYASLGYYTITGSVAGGQSSVAAIFYKDCSYSGASASLPAGSYTLSQLQSYGILNDDISSLRVSSGYQVILYWDDNFGGSTLTVSSDNDCLVDEGWNDKVSSLKIVPTAAASTVIQAESYSSMSGVQTETTTDTDGGLDVGYIDTGDWMAYNSINFPTSGSYLVEYRVASMSGGGQLSLDLNAGSSILGYLNVPATGGWQTWTTISHTVTVSAGTYNVGVYAQVGGWNLNWIRITKVGAALATGATASKVTAQAADLRQDARSGFVVYPNPAKDQLNIYTGENLSAGIITIYDMPGRAVLNIKSGSPVIDVTSLRPGIYTLVFSSKDRRIVRQFVKK
jgi:hypothetical protein